MSSGLEIIRMPGLDGFVYSLKWGGTPLLLPLQNWPVSPRELLKDSQWPLLEVLDELVDAGTVEVLEEGLHRLPWQGLDSLTGDEWDRLHLPDVSRPMIELITRNSITSPKFSIDALVYVPEYDGDLMTWGARTGRVISTGRGDEFLLDATSSRLLDVLSEGAGPTIEDRLMYAAEVKTLGASLDAKLDAMLERETFELVEDVNADPRVQADGSIQIVARFDHPSVPETDLRTLSPTHPYSEQRDGKKRHRFVVTRRAADTFRQVDESAPRIPASDVVRFLENPESFVPEDWPLDLARFSERVRGLKLRAYRAQPFIHARGTDRGWFEITSGVRLDTPSDEDAPSDTASEMPLDEFERLVTEANRQGSRTIYDGERWIELPPDAATAIADVNRLRDTLDGTTDSDSLGRLEASRLPYVLDIFTNVDRFEFNQPFVDAVDYRRTRLEVVPPREFQGELKAYQLEGFRRLLQVRQHKLGLLLADEMGLGKTVQVLAALAHWKAEGSLCPSLLVVPLTLIENWENECGKFTPLLTYYVHRGPARNRLPSFLSRFDLVITPYDTVIRDQLDLGQVDWQVVILDEAQRIKNATTGRTNAIKALKAAHRVAMTGTPVENDILDLWSICDFVQPGFLGSSREFAAKYRPKSDMTAEEWDAHGEVLAGRLAPILLRRTKADVDLSLPPKSTVEARVPLSREQYARYRDVVERVRRRELNGLEAIGRLRALTAHPLALEGRPNWASIPPERLPKLQATLDILSNVQKAGEKALIFTESRRIQEMLRYWIWQIFDMFPPIINGTTPARQATVDAFTAQAGFGVLILSPMAAGVGLNIVAANHVIHYTRWWNPAVESQATDRVHRLGQERPVTVYYPIATDAESWFAQGTVDEIVDRLLQEKTELAVRSLIPMRNDDLQAEVMEQAFAVDGRAGFHVKE